MLFFPWVRDLTMLTKRKAKKKAQSSGVDAETLKQLSLKGQCTIWWEVSGGVRVKLYRFPAGRADLHPDHVVVLGDAVAFLKKAEVRQAWIIGHADVGEGDEAQNRLLSERRGKAVKDFLTARGITDTQMLAMGSGNGVTAAGDVVSREAADDPDYDPAEHRMVELCLLNNNIERALREHQQDLRRRGYNL
jgi:outer membrane protein OmpA-like peptidoglycan-associated protein